MNAALALQLASSALINLGLALLAGIWLARTWLQQADGAWLSGSAPLLRRAEMTALAACVAGLASAVWAGAATMSGKPPIAALADFHMVLTTTEIGHAAAAGIAIVAALCLLTKLAPAGNGRRACQGVLLLAFALDRAGVSHAADLGFASVAVLVETLHIATIATWLGGVIVGGWLVLPQSHALPLLPLAARGAYLARLSAVSTVALAGLLATGLFNTWQRVGTPDKLVDNLYGLVLLAKLAAVLLALGLGGYNRLVGFPALARSADRGASRAIAVLRVESALLVLALFAAVLLTTQEPPATL